MLKSSMLAAAALGWALATATAGADEAKSPAKAVPSTAADKACLHQTGTLIPEKGHNCAASGHSFSQGDIRRTGADTAGGALRLLSPALTVHH